MVVYQTSRVIGTGTFGCGSVIVEGEDFIAENVTFENSAPQVIELLLSSNRHLGESLFFLCLGLFV